MKIAVFSMAQETYATQNKSKLIDPHDALKCE